MAALARISFVGDTIQNVLLTVGFYGLYEPNRVRFFFEDHCEYVAVYKEAELMCSCRLLLY